MSASGDIVDRLWERLQVGGIRDPRIAVEQISFLALLKWYGDPAFSGRPPSSAIEWDRVRTGSAWVDLHNGLLPTLRTSIDSDAFARATDLSQFAIPTPEILDYVVDALDELFPTRAPQRALGALFDTMLERIVVSGGRAEFITPRWVVNMIVALLDPQRDELVCDPTVGSGGFLVAARSHVERLPAIAADDRFVGYDVNEGMVRLAVLNLVMHGAGDPHVARADTLGQAFDWPNADVVMANPPWGMKLDPDVIHPALRVQGASSEYSFLELCRHMIGDDGRFAVIVPMGVLFSESARHVNARQRLLTEAHVDAIVTLPPGAFKPQTDIRSAIIVARTPGPTERVVFCDGEDPDSVPSAIKYRLGDSAQPVLASARVLADQIWEASYPDIASRAWSLAPDVYRQRTPAPGASDDDDPGRLLDALQELEDTLQGELRQARSLIDRLR